MERTCTSCGKPLTATATFCTYCGNEAAPPPPPDAPRFCGSCGAPKDPAARFCSACGADGQAAATPPPPPLAPPPVSVTAPEIAPSAPPFPEPDEGPDRKKLFVYAGLAALALLSILFWFNRYEWLGMERPPEETGNASATMGEEATMYVVANANMRDRATVNGSQLMGKLQRGATVVGTMQPGEDGTSTWLKLKDSGNFVSAVNLSPTQPPQLTRSFNKPWFAPSDLPILARPDANAPVLETAKTGGQYQLVGLTENGFAEVLMVKGGVGYFNASGIDLAAASKQPIKVEFSGSDCGYGAEIDGLFRKLGQDAENARKAIERKSYPDEEARLAALETFDSKDRYLKLNRSFGNLTVSGIGSHYESSSVYFNNPANDVQAAFRAKGFAIQPTGVFDSGLGSETGASISATDGEAKTYGQSELSCGV